MKVGLSWQDRRPSPQACKPRTLKLMAFVGPPWTPYFMSPAVRWHHWYEEEGLKVWVRYTVASVRTHARLTGTARSSLIESAMTRVLGVYSKRHTTLTTYEKYTTRGTMAGILTSTRVVQSTADHLQLRNHISMISKAHLHCSTRPPRGKRTTMLVPTLCMPRDFTNGTRLDRTPRPPPKLPLDGTN